MTNEAGQGLQRALTLSKDFAGRAEAERTLAELKSSPVARGAR